MTDVQIIALIAQRRRQLLVHSYLYYDRNANLIPDSTWSAWGEELVQLQKQYPRLSFEVPYYEDFIDFDASTGFNLNYRQPKIISTAEHLLAYCNKN